jgi:hypothetical protein
MQVGYLERVNAELCELLEKCDAEAVSQQGSLQAEKRELTNRMRQLQEEVRHKYCIAPTTSFHTCRMRYHWRKQHLHLPAVYPLKLVQTVLLPSC